MGGNSKKRKVSAGNNKDTEMGITLKRGTLELAVGTKMEAMDYLGNW